MKTISVLAVFCVTILISCQKTVDGALPPEVVNKTDSIYLHKLVVLDTTRPAGRDTVEKYFFTYDDSKRIVKVFSYWVGLRDSSSHDYFYLGHDTLPFKIVDHSIEDHGAGFFHYADTIYYSYANGVVRKDSVLSWNLTTGDIAHAPYVAEYTVSGNTVKKVSRNYGVLSGRYALVESDTAAFDVTYAAGNLTSHTSTSSSPHDHFVGATYDDKPNPLAKIFPARYPVFDSYLMADWYSQKNNPLRVEFQTDIYSPMDNDLLTYTYRHDNYPLTATYSSTMLSPYNKIVYLYTTL
jgi:hypothetical protein